MIELAGWSESDAAYIRATLCRVVVPGLRLVTQLLERALDSEAHDSASLEIRLVLDLYFEHRDTTQNLGRPLSDADRYRVYEIFRGLELGLLEANRRLEILDGGDDGPDYFGAAEEDSDEIIYVYKPWWALESRIEQAGVLVHELTHIWHRALDKGYSHPWCNPVRYTLPYKGPEIQLWTDDLLNNADTYQGFFEAVCKKESEIESLSS
jgi:hypothetical protein